MPSRSTNLLAAAAANPRKIPAKELPPLPGQESGDDESEDPEKFQKSLKRKSASEDTTSTLKESRRQKKKAKKSATASNAKEEAKEELLNEDIGRMDSQLTADYFARQMKRFESDMSVVELEDRRVPVSAFVDTSGFDQPRKLSALPAFVERYSKRDLQRLKQAPKANGAPHTIVIAAAGIRAADLTRALRVFQTKDAMVAKLFAKHIKLKEAVESTKKSRMHIGVGTPQRLSDLIDQGALSLDHLERVVVDATSLNQKQRSILDMSETEIPLAKLLSRAEFKKRFEDDKTKIAVY